jgi:hypothetical protein
MISASPEIRAVGYDVDGLLAAERAYCRYIDDGGSPDDDEALRLIGAVDDERRRIRQGIREPKQETFVDDAGYLNGPILDAQAYRWRAGVLPAMPEWIADYPADDTAALERLITRHLEDALALGARMLVDHAIIEP